MDTKRSLIVSLGLLGLCGTAAAQPLPVAYRDEVFTNTSGLGTPGLACRIFYPATSAGVGTPMLRRAGGYPVVLHLHGNGGDGRATPEYSAAVAAAGYVMVMQDTASTFSTTQYNDAIATVPALQAENVKVGSPYEGQLDMTRFGLIGHSMGGGNVFKVLASNTVPRLGIAYAPANQTTWAPSVRVPLLIVVGQGDTTINPYVSANEYRAASAYTGAKVLYGFDGSCDHSTMLANPFTQTQRDVFDRSLRVTIGFLDTWLAGDPRGFERVAGTDARSEPRLAQLLLAVERPLLWHAWTSTSTVRFSFVTEPGGSALLAAARRATIPTPFGLLGLDLASLVILPQVTPDPRLCTVDVALPPSLWVGNPVLSCQAFGSTRAPLPQLTNVIAVRPGA